jgi:hypothetical protein
MLCTNRDEGLGTNQSERVVLNKNSFNSINSVSFRSKERGVLFAKSAIYSN